MRPMGYKDPFKDTEHHGVEWVGPLAVGAETALSSLLNQHVGLLLLNCGGLAVVPSLPVVLSPPVVPSPPVVLSLPVLLAACSPDEQEVQPCSRGQPRLAGNYLVCFVILS